MSYARGLLKFGIIMNKVIAFSPLQKKHFSLLLKWLETPHIKKWWDPNINWTLKLIQKKYITYVKRFKRLGLKSQIIERPMYAFIINYDGIDIGYIQCYKKSDFPPEQGYSTLLLPEGCAAIDLYIGELDYVGKQIGPQVLDVFLNEFVFKIFENAFVDPDAANIRAIRAYEKAGFKKIKEENNTVLMVKTSQCKTKQLLS